MVYKYFYFLLCFCLSCNFCVRAGESLRPYGIQQVDGKMQVFYVIKNQVKLLNRGLTEAFKGCSLKTDKKVFSDRIENLNLVIDNFQYIFAGLGIEAGDLFVCMKGKLDLVKSIFAGNDENRCKKAREELLSFVRMKKLFFESLGSKKPQPEIQRCLLDSFYSLGKTFDPFFVVKDGKKLSSDSQVSLTDFDSVLQLKNSNVLEALKKCSDLAELFLKKINNASLNFLEILADMVEDVKKLKELCDFLLDDESGLIDSYNARSMSEKHVGSMIDSTFVCNMLDWVFCKVSPSEANRKKMFPTAEKHITSIKHTMGFIESVLLWLNYDEVCDVGLSDFCENLFPYEIIELRRVLSKKMRADSTSSVGKVVDYVKLLAQKVFIPVESSLNWANKSVSSFANTFDGSHLELQAMSDKINDLSQVCAFINKILYLKPSLVLGVIGPFIGAFCKENSFLRGVLSEKLGKDTTDLVVKFANKSWFLMMVRFAENQKEYVAVLSQVLDVFADVANVLNEKYPDDCKKYFELLKAKLKFVLSSAGFFTKQVELHSLAASFKLLTLSQRRECLVQFYKKNNECVAKELVRVEQAQLQRKREKCKKLFDEIAGLYEPLLGALAEKKQLLRSQKDANLIAKNRIVRDQAQYNSWFSWRYWCDYIVGNVKTQKDSMSKKLVRLEKKEALRKKNVAYVLGLKKMIMSSCHVLEKHSLEKDSLDFVVKEFCGVKKFLRTNWSRLVAIE